MSKTYWPHQHALDLNGNRDRRSLYTVEQVTDEAVWIVDLDGPKSITNDAEGVCAEIALHYSGRRIFYRDTDGNWDELVHDCGSFTGFKPARDRALPLDILPRS